MQIDERMIEWKPVEDGIDERMVKWKSPATSIAEKMSRDRRGSGLAALNGLTFGFADEVAGAIGGQGVRDKMRSELEAYRKDSPGMSIANEMIGGIPFGLGLGKLVPALNTLGRQMLAGGAIGGATGAIQGAGDSQADTPAGVAGDALKGGAVSLAMGAGLPVGISGVGLAGQQLLSRYMPEMSKRWGAEKIAQAFSRDGITGEQAARRMEALGPEARMVDGGRDSVRQTLDSLATMPGQTKTNVESAILQRQKTRGERMRGAAEEAFGVDGFRLAPEMQTWMAQREAAAGPLYEKVTKMTVRPDAGLMSIINAADELGATKLGQSMATARQQPWTLDTSNGQPMLMRDLDNLKKGLDQMVSKETKPDGKMTPLGASFNELRQSLIGKLDKMTMGQYQRARDAFAGPSAIMDAATAGQRALLSDDASIKTMMAGLSGSEKDAFALGAFEALRAKLGTQSGQSEMMKLWRQDGMREKLQAIFGDEKAYLSFARKMYGEKTMAELEKVGRGSQTAARLSAMQDLAEPAASLATSSTPVGILANTRRLLNQLQTPEPVRDAMGKQLLSRDVQALRDIDPIIQELNKLRTQSTIGLGLGAGLL